ncbi:MAG: serine/threonine-protein kinase [Nannocystaceae bacterium]
MSGEVEAPSDESAATVLDGPSVDTTPLEPEPVAPFLRIGRYAILRRLAEGAMGAVYVAYDEHLDRKVAIKVVRAMGQRSADVYDRMLREAQGLARLNHPNVVHIYEADVHEGRVYLVMELIEGVTLREWTRQGPRSRAELLRRCVEAGRGLAAAHGAGLVHRDFKPDNVMVGADGRVRVLDFGLVRAESESQVDAALRVSVDRSLFSSSASLSSEITVAHTLIGTPAYMSPEQHMRQPADVRSDIFAFAVVLYEALLGVRPFGGKEQGEIMRAVLSQELSEPADGRRLPRWLHRVILRGLALAPGDRWQTMDEFLAALARDPARTRRRIVAGLAIAGGLAAGAAAIVTATRGEAEACSGGEAMIAEVWGPSQANALAEAFAASRVDFADDVASRVTVFLDRYSAAWASAHRDACMSHRRGESSSERLDQRMSCVDARRRELAAVVHALRDPDGEVIERAIPMIYRLAAPATCLDAAASGGEALRDLAIDDLLARARAEEGIGRYDAGLSTLDEADARRRDRGAPELEVEIDALRGRLLLDAGRYAEAESILEDAYFGGLALGDARAAIDGALDRVHLGVVTHADPGLVGLWLRAAESHTRRASDEARADYHAVAGEFHGKLVIDYEASRVDWEEALRRRRAALPADHPAIVGDLRGLGAALFKLGRLAEAEARLIEARELAERVLGPRHPRVAEIVANLGLIAARGGRYDEAVELAAHGLEIREGAFGLRHPGVADSLSNLGELELRRGRPLAAIVHLERAVAVASEAFGAEHPKLALYYGSLGIALYKAGRVDEALVIMERALSLAEASLGPDHPTTAIFRANLGEVLNDRGHFALARDMVGSALKVLREALGESRADLGPIYRELARAHLGLGEGEAAIEAARRGYALAAGDDQITADERAKTAWVLAQALDTRADARDEALSLAAAARSELASGAPGEVTLLATIDAWIAARRR